MLYDNGISSVPVNDPTIATYPKHIAGFVDLLDILAYLVQVFDALPKYSPSDIPILADAFLHKPVGDLLDYSSRDKFTAVLEEDDLMHVIQLFATGVHRVGIVNSFNEIQNLLSQLDVARLIAENITLLGPMAGKSLQELGLVPSIPLHHNVAVVNATDVAIVSFHKLHEHKISAAPVIDARGVFVGTISASDLKGLTHEVFGALLQHTSTFVDLHSYYGHTLKSGQVVCYPSDSMSKVINLVTKFRVHRVWVVDPANRPIGVVTLTDICKVVSGLQ